MPPSRKRVAVVICSLGRAGTLAEMMPYLMRQTVLPSRIVLVVTTDRDVPDFEAVLPGSPVRPEVIISEKGSAKQRNAGLEAVIDDCDYVFFQDDDYVPGRHAVAGIIKTFEAYPEASGLTGKLLADGINSPGYSIGDAGRILSRWEAASPGAETAPAELIKSGLIGLYGCNMAVRAAQARTVRFDEKLPLYAWQEDLDFGARLPGIKVKSDAVVGVHCGVKSGRERNGEILGYSQVANPLYLIRKGSLPWRFGLSLCLKNVTANHLRALRPERWIDRSGRARGNRRAIADAFLRRSYPEKILEMK